MRQITIKRNLVIGIFLLICINLFSQDSMKKFIFIEWEKNELASEYFIQISDSTNFRNILYQKKIKESIVKLDPNPKYRYGRIAGIDEHGVRGEYSEIFEIEQRIVENKPPEPIIQLPQNYLRENHTITLDLDDDKNKLWRTYYKINDGKWLTYSQVIVLSKQGLNILQYYSEDKFGNRERIKTMEYIFDSEGPNIDVTFQNSYTDKENFIFTGKNSTISVKINDLYSGLLSSKIYLRTIYTSQEVEINPKGYIVIPSNLANSTVELFIVSTDRLNNITNYSKFFKHDLMPPELTFESSNKFDGNKRQFSISHIKAHDYFSGLQSIYYSLNKSDMQIYREPIMIFEPGEYEIKIQAVDNVGNKSPIQYERIFIAEPKTISINKTP